MKLMPCKPYLAAILGLMAINLSMQYVITGPVDENMRFLFIAGAMARIATVVLFVYVVYRSWLVIGDRLTRPSPGMAAGFLFIPIFNIYWQFKAIASYPNQFMLFGQRYGIGANPPPRWPYMSYCLLPFIQLPFHFVATDAQSIVYSILHPAFTIIYNGLTLAIFVLNIISHNQLLNAPRYPNAMRNKRSSILYE